MNLPRIVAMIRGGGALTDLEAAAAKLWLSYGGKELDADGAIAAAVKAHWAAKPGGDPYWDFLSLRTSCDACGETYKLENLSICPNCFNVYCYRHGRDCSCGHKTLG